MASNQISEARAAWRRAQVHALRRDLAPYVLLLLMYVLLTWSIQAAKWSEGLQVLNWVGILAVSAGFFLAHTRWPALAAHLYSLVLGFVSLTLIMAAQITTDLSWPDRALELALRFQKWLNILINKGMNYDNLMFVVQLALYLWAFGYLAGWGLFRRRKLGWALLPCGVGLLFNLYYAPPRLASYFVLYLLVALTLVVRLNVGRREEEWLQAGVGFSEDVRFDLLRDGLFISILAIGMAWFLPAQADTNALTRLGVRLEAPWRRVQTEWNRMFGALATYTEGTPAPFTRDVRLGGPVELSDAPVMDVTAMEGRYWRVIALDFYSGAGWMATYDEIGPLGDGASPISPPPFALRQPVVQQIYLYRPEDHTLASAGQFQSADLEAEGILQYLPREGSTAERPPVDVEIAYARFRLRPEDSYTAVSSISVADEASLRAAGTRYPEWVQERFLQLPAHLPARVRDLGRSLTNGIANPYDQATAIEAYLRREMTYNDQIEPPPEDRDPIDYFLVDSREGYCDYYASAMVLLARSAGIPARLARGYATGDWIAEAGVYRVLERHGHAWPEMFFPGLGWVEFEPTVSQAPLVRPTPQPIDAAGAGSQLPAVRPTEDLADRYGREDDILGDGADAGAARGWWSRLPAWGRAGAQAGGALLLAIGLFWALWRILEPRRLSESQRAYLRLTRAGGWVGAPVGEQQTPFEYAGSLSDRLPKAQGDIWAIARLYVRERFARSTAEGCAGGALRHWWRVVPRLMQQGIIRLWKAPGEWWRGQASARRVQR